MPLGLRKSTGVGAPANDNLTLEATQSHPRDTSNRVFGSPHLPVPIPQQSADDEPIEPCAPRGIILATGWIIAWALTALIVANVIGPI
jgi:hypothetical protein